MKLRLIKNWGQYKIGDVILDPSPATLEALVHTYKVAEEEEEKKKVEIDEEGDIVKVEEEDETVKEEETTEIVGVIDSKEDREMTEEEMEEEAEIDKEAEEEIKESYIPPKRKKAPKSVSSKSKK